MSQAAAAEPKTKSLYDWIDRNNIVFLFVGILLMAAGIIIDIAFEKDPSLWINIVSHLFLILGEALIVFFLINVVLEAKYKERFLGETKILITEEKDKIIASFEGLRKRLEDETKILVKDTSNNIFKVIIQEKTSKEIADIICDDGFFKSDFLKIQRELVYTFQELDDKIVLIQFDDFDIENISETESSYSLNLSLTPTVSKKYSFKSAQYKKWDETQYKDLREDAFQKEPIPNIPGGQEYTLKEKIALLAKKKVSIHRTMETIFIPNPDGIDDNFFTTRYMMPFPLKVIVPRDYTFIFYPTFPQNKLEKPSEDPWSTGFTRWTYQIPFLFPGQGFFFSLVKKTGDQTTLSTVTTGTENVVQKLDNQIDGRGEPGAGILGK